MIPTMWTEEEVYELASWDLPGIRKHRAAHTCKSWKNPPVIRTVPKMIPSTPM